MRSRQLMVRFLADASLHYAIVTGCARREPTIDLPSAQSRDTVARAHGCGRCGLSTIFLGVVEGVDWMTLAGRRTLGGINPPLTLP